jgi:hypothetical protein
MENADNPRKSSDPPLAVTFVKLSACAADCGKQCRPAPKTGPPRRWAAEVEDQLMKPTDKLCEEDDDFA